jgi:hypothetical protein
MVYAGRSPQYGLEICSPLRVPQTSAGCTSHAPHLHLTGISLFESCTPSAVQLQILILPAVNNQIHIQRFAHVPVIRFPWLHAFPVWPFAGEIRIYTISTSSATCDREPHRDSSCLITGRRTHTPEAVIKQSHGVMIDH